MRNSIVVFNFFVQEWKYPYIQSKIWYPDYFEYEEFIADVHFFCFCLEVSLFRKIVSKNQNCLSQNLKHRLIPIICGIQWWFWFFHFLNWKYPFWINLVQKFKIISLSWHLIPRLFWIECVKSNGDVHLFYFRPFFASFVETIHLAFWCYLIKLPAIYSQRREASVFFLYSNIKITRKKTINTPD